MDEITISQLLTSPIFWFSTVLVGIIVGVVGNFFTNFINKMWANFSESKRKENEEKQKAFLAEVQSLVADSSKATELKIDAIYFLLSSAVRLMFYLLLSNFVFFVPAMLPIIESQYLVIFLNITLSILAVPIATSALNRSDHVRQVLHEYYREKERVEKTDNNPAL